jgi:hypothetical protein
LRNDATSHGNIDDLSTITGTVPQGIQTVQSEPTTNQGSSSNVSGVTRSINQVTLDDVGQAFNRRRINAYITGPRSSTSQREILAINVQSVV